jgi:DNA-binding MarR family transcriptional regulator
MRMTELAESLYNSKSGLTYQITQMEKSGLVRRRDCLTTATQP